MFHSRNPAISHFFFDCPPQRTCNSYQQEVRSLAVIKILKFLLFKMIVAWDTGTTQYRSVSLPVAQYKYELKHVYIIVLTFDNISNIFIYIRWVYWYYNMERIRFQMSENFPPPEIVYSSGRIQVRIKTCMSMKIRLPVHTPTILYEKNQFMYYPVASTR